MKNITKIMLASALLMPTMSFAGGLSYTYIQGGYTSITTDQYDVDSDGYYVGGSFLVAPNVFIIGSYSDVSSDEFTVGAVTGQVDSTSYNAGLGIRAPITDFMDANLAAAYVHSESDGTASSAFGSVSGSSDGDGYSVSAGLRTLLGERLEINTGYNYVDVSDGQGSFDIGGLIHFTKMISASAAYRFGDDANAWTVGGRLNF